jgi:hypothetical protein
MLMMEGRTKRSFFSPAVRLALVLCAILASSFVVSATSALAAEGKAPTIESMGAEIGGEVTVSAHIDPEGFETTYEIKLECGSNEPVPCDSLPIQRKEGDLAADYEVHEVSLTLTGLQPGTYWFGVRASNSAGEVSWSSDILKIPPESPGSFPNGTAPVEVVRAPYLGEASRQLQAIAEQNARERDEQHAKEAAAAKEKEEAKAREASLLANEEAARERQAKKETGGVSLAATNVTVQSNGTALVKLTCLGIASCHGKLRLTTKGKKKTHTVALATVSFSIAGDETKSVKIKLDASGRALLDADRGRLSANLALLELAPSPQNTQAKTVHLVQQKSHGDALSNARRATGRH